MPDRTVWVWVATHLNYNQTFPEAVAATLDALLDFINAKNPHVVRWELHDWTTGDDADPCFGLFGFAVHGHTEWSLDRFPLWPDTTTDSEECAWGCDGEGCPHVHVG